MGIDRGEGSYLRRRGDGDLQGGTRVSILQRLALPVVMIAAFAGGWGLMRHPQPQVEVFPDEGHLHVSTGSPHAPYRTDPPTSGPHSEEHFYQSGFLEQAPRSELLVHGLEDGFVVIYYSDQLPPATRDWLRTLMQGYESQVVAIPRPQREEIILTAWRRMLRLRRYDPKAMGDFIAQFRGVPHPMGD